jgi:hypothetical protein
MDEQQFKIASTAEDLRLCIIENSIYIEELTSNVLGTILDIDWSSSKSFGNGSTSLSFNQKLQLIQDIKGIEKESLKKITCLANIRNKFAHVSQVNSFEKLFSSSNVGKEIKKNFLAWYFDVRGDSDIHPSKLEFVYRLCFYLLVNDVIEILLKINDTHMFNRGYADGKKEANETLVTILLESLIKNDQKLVVINAIQELERRFK